MLRHCRGCRTHKDSALRIGTVLESRAAAGESPLQANKVERVGILSTAGHEEPCGNPAGPSAKAKYY